MQTIVVLSLLFFVVFLLSTRLLPLEIVVLSVPVVLSLTGVLPLDRAFSGFSQPAVIAIVSLFILSEGLSRTKVVRKVALLLGSIRHSHPRLLLPALLLTVGLFSMFLNDTGTTALFLPVALSLLREAKLSRKPFLLPLGYAAILGGSATLIGTSSNIVVSGYLESLSLPPFRMFDFLPVGGGAFLLGVIWLLLTGKKGPNDAESPEPHSHNGDDRPYDLEIVLGADFPYHGQKFDETPLSTTIGLVLSKNHDLAPITARQRAQTFLRASWDWSRKIVPPPPSPEQAGPVPPPDEEEVLAPGHHLHVQGTLDQLHRLSDIRGLSLEPVHAFLPGTASRSGRTTLGPLMESEDWIFAQAVLSPRSGMVGRKLSSLQFLLPPEVDIVGVHREGGRRAPGHLADMTIEPGDILLLLGPRPAISELSGRNIFLYLDRYERETFRSGKALSALLILGGVVLSNVLGWLPLSLSALIGALLMVVSGCLTLEEARSAIEWRVVMLLGGLFPLGWALSETGIGERLATHLGTPGLLPHPELLLALLMGTTAILVQFLSHNLVALVMAPIAMDLSRTFHLSPYPLMMGVAFASTFAFLTPFSHPVNTLLWGPGDYRMADFMKRGTVVMLLAFGWGLFSIPHLFPFGG